MSPSDFVPPLATRSRRLAGFWRRRYADLRCLSRLLDADVESEGLDGAVVRVRVVAREGVALVTVSVDFPRTAPRICIVSGEAIIRPEIAWRLGDDATATLAEAITDAFGQAARTPR